MLTYDEALERILDAAGDPLSAERVPLGEARGRALAERVLATEDLPPFDNSAVDGYVVRPEDTRDARPDNPARLTYRGDDDQTAGSKPSLTPVGPNAAVYVATGAPVPPGTEAIVMVEDTAEADGQRLLVSAPGSSRYIRRAGSDVRRGEVVAEPGTVVDAGLTGLLAALGMTTVPVSARPRVGILTTGDEVVPASATTLEPGRIRNSNGPALEAAVWDAGATVAAHVHAADTPEATRDAVLALAGCFDVIVSTGGVSMGKHDYVKAVVEEVGALDFWRIAIKPGKPLAFGRVGGALFVGLPGNPVSSLVTFELFVRPVLRRLAGHADVVRPRAVATLTDDLPHTPGRREFVRARVEWRASDGVCLAAPTGAQGSHRLSSMVGANALLVAHEDHGDYRAGESLPALLLV